MDSIPERRLDLGLKLKDKIAARLQRQGMDESRAMFLSCRDIIAARRIGLRNIHGVSIARLLR